MGAELFACNKSSQTTTKPKANNIREPRKTKENTTDNKMSDPKALKFAILLFCWFSCFFDFSPNCKTPREKNQEKHKKECRPQGGRPKGLGVASLFSMVFGSCFAVWAEIKYNLDQKAKHCYFYFFNKSNEHVFLVFIQNLENTKREENTKKATKQDCRPQKNKPMGVGLCNMVICLFLVLSLSFSIKPNFSRNCKTSREIPKTRKQTETLLQIPRSRAKGVGVCNIIICLSSVC